MFWVCFWNVIGRIQRSVNRFLGLADYDYAIGHDGEEEMPVVYTMIGIVVLGPFNLVRRVFGCPSIQDVHLIERLVLEEWVNAWPDEQQELVRKDWSEYQENCEDGPFGVCDKDMEFDEDCCSFACGMQSLHLRFRGGSLMIQCNDSEACPPEEGVEPEYSVEAYWMKDAQLYSANSEAKEKIPHISVVGEDIYSETDGMAIRELDSFMRTEEKLRAKYGDRWYDEC